MEQYLSHLAIHNRTIGPGCPAYIIAEAGINHNGDPETARRLVDTAVQAQADAVKFQMRTLSALYPPDALRDPERAEKEVGFLLPYLEQATLAEEEMAGLADYCSRRGVEFLCTPWDIASADFLETLDVHAYKVASADLTNWPLLERLAKTGKPLILSTGMSRLSEIGATVDLLMARRVEFALLHCQSTYPAPFKDVNLRFLEKLREFGVPVGYSGHERGIAVSTVAAALGACIIERHVTLDRSMPGPDHAASLEPAGLAKQVRDIRIVEEAMGEPRRGLSRGELLNRMALAKSLVAARAIQPGESVVPDMIAVMGPGNGIPPHRRHELEGLVVRRFIAAGEQFRESDLTGRPLAEAAKLSALRWGVVARYRDLSQMVELQPHLVEVHLTDVDLDAPVPELAPCPQELVVHAPEYYRGRLLDLASGDPQVRRRSAEVIKRVADVARRLKPRFAGTKGEVRIVIHPGGMSHDQAPESRAACVSRLCESLSHLRAEPGVEMLVENMPPYPWYFGGQWYHNAFMSADDMLQVAAGGKVRVCLDISHAALACAAGHGDLASFVADLAPHVSHVHVADASGTDGEGLQIGEGEVDFQSIMPTVAGMDATVLPEIWLGHHNGGEGFLIALSRLVELWPR